MDEQQKNISSNLPVIGCVSSHSLCKEYNDEWEREKAFSRMGGWELVYQAELAKRKWEEWEKKHCR